MVSKAAEYTKTTDTKEKKPGRYVFYVNVDQYCKRQMRKSSSSPLTAPISRSSGKSKISLEI